MVKRRGKAAYKDVYDEHENMGYAPLDSMVDPCEDFRYQLDEELSNNELWELLEYSLSEREFNILVYRYKEDLTLEETSKFWGVTRERIRLIEAKALRKCRHSTRRTEILKLFPLLKMDVERGERRDLLKREREAIQRKKSEAKAKEKKEAQRLEDAKHYERLRKKYEREAEKRRKIKEREDYCMKVVRDDYEGFLKKLDDPVQRALLVAEGGYNIIIHHIDRKRGYGYEQEYTPSLEMF
jgi:transcriptional regulator